MKQECVRDYETLIQPQQLHGLEMTQEQAIQLAKQLIDEIKTGAKTIHVVAFNRSLFVTGE
jgi:hypothetical protein